MEGIADVSGVGGGRPDVIVFACGAERAERNVNKATTDEIHRIGMKICGI